jgi:hypothetical protein
MNRIVCTGTTHPTTSEFDALAKILDITAAVRSDLISEPACDADNV